MKTNTIAIAAGAAVVGLTLLYVRRSSAAPVYDPAAGGITSLYNQRAGQQAGFDSAIAASWRQLQDSVFRTQPDFWI